MTEAARGQLHFDTLWRTPRTWSPHICWTAVLLRARRTASTRSARSRSKQRSTRSACTSIPSCSAPNRYGRSISPVSMLPSPMKAGALSPYSIELIERNGKTMYQHEATPLVFMQSADRVAFAQLKSMLQGVLSRGTARRIGYLAPYVGGKTGTSDGENDAWFVGFSNEVTVAVWVGYDNAGGKRRTLGGGSTGASVAAPIFAHIMEATWASYAPRTALAPPSNEALQYLEARRTGDGRGSYAEYFRADKAGRIIEPKLAGRGSYEAREARRLQRARALAAAEWNYRVFNQGQGSWTSGWGQPQWNDYQPRSRSVFFDWR